MRRAGDGPANFAVSIAVSNSPGRSTVIRVMSVPGPWKYCSAFTTRSPLTLLITIEASRAISAGAVSDGFTATQRSVRSIVRPMRIVYRSTLKRVIPPGLHLRIWRAVVGRGWVR